MPPRVLVVIGGSAGGLQALSTIVEHLPASFPGCVLIVMHSSGQGVLPQILERVGSLPVTVAVDGDALASGRIYVGRSDFHLVVRPHSVALVHGPRENGFRPAIDPLFRTAGRAFGARAIGVVLSGALSDGTYGLSVLQHYGGVCIVQDPREAAIPNMPQSAIQHVDVDYVLPAAEIGPMITHLAEQLGSEEVKGTDMPRSEIVEPQRPSEETEVRDMNQLFGPSSGLTCPDCGGALWEIQENRVLRYQCHVGHQYAPENLDAGQREAIDSALWSAVRALEEHADLKTRMARRAATRGLLAVSEGFAEGARDAREQAQQIRAVLFTSGNGDTVRAIEAVETTPLRRVRGQTRAKPRGDQPVRRQRPARRRAKS